MSRATESNKGEGGENNNNKKKTSHTKAKGLAMMILKAAPGLAGSADMKKLLMSRAGLKLIVNRLSYLESIIADHEWFAFVTARIKKGMGRLSLQNNS